MVLTTAQDDSTYARRLPCQPPPAPKMSGGIFLLLSTTNYVINGSHWIPLLSVRCSLDGKVPVQHYVQTGEICLPTL